MWRYNENTNSFKNKKDITLLEVKSDVTFSNILHVFVNLIKVAENVWTMHE